MSYNLTFTVRGSQDTCLFWQAQLSEFLASSGIELPKEVDINITAVGGNGLERGGGAAHAAGRRSDTTFKPQARANRDLNFGGPHEGGQDRAHQHHAPRVGENRDSRDAPWQLPEKVENPNASNAPSRTKWTNQAKMVSKSGEQLPARLSRSLEQVRTSVRKHGAVGIAGIGRKFRICDDDMSGHIDNQEFAKAMQELGFRFGGDELAELFGYFDDDGNGKVNYEEFLAAVRPPMTLRRKRMVQKVFEMLDTNRSGVLEPIDLKGRFNAAGDPRVANREKSAQAVAQEFLSTFDVFDQDGLVGLDEFLKYYQGVSACIDDDSYFELMMRNSWHMSGGTGWCQNTTCLRVLVEHMDGSETVEELQNDLGLDKSNYKEVCLRLQQQGITDIARVKLYE